MSKPQESPKHLAQVADLQSVTLVSSSFELSRDQVGQDGNVSIDVSVNTRFEKNKFKKFPSALIGDFTAKVRAATKKDEPVFDLMVKYRVAYGLKKDIHWSEEEVQLFATKNLIIHAWPYARESIDMVSRKANLPPVLLPLMPVFDKQKK